MLGEFSKADNFTIRSEKFVGFYATETLLNTAFPRGKVGQYAVVTATSTVWAWNNTTKVWADTTIAGSVTSVNGYTGVVTLVKGDIALGNVDNTADADKPISDDTQDALDLKIDKATLDAKTVLCAQADDTPVAVELTTNTVLGRIAGNIVAVAIDSDISTVSANDDTVPSAKATKTALNLKMDVNSKVKFTAEGGLAISLINKTGAASVKGTIVCADDTVDEAVDIAGISSEVAIGTIYEDAIADGSAVWVVVSGIAEVLLKDGEAGVCGARYCVSDTAGRAAVITGTPDETEVGRGLKTVALGTDVLTKINLQFR